jgi:hypothetical protein
MKIVRLYSMTVSSTWYDKEARGAKEYELHFAVARRGNIRTVRRRLGRRGVPYFQSYVYRRVRKWIPRSKIKVRFEREQPAGKSEGKISIEGRSMLFRGRRWWAFPLGKWELNYSKRKRKRREQSNRPKNR